MKKTIAGVLLICLLLSSVFAFTGCSSSKNVVGVWKATSWPDYAPIYMYMYLYSDGTGDFYGPEFNEIDNTDHRNAFEWSCRGDVFQIDGRSDKYTVKDGKMYNKQGGVEYTLVSIDTSVDIPIYSFN